MTGMLSGLLETWSAVYSAHAALRTLIEFVHIGGLIAAGGCAITADLATILATRDRTTRPTDIRLLKHTHAIVLGGLVSLIVSGLLLLAADTDTYLYSKVFWLKMGLVVLLLANGAVMLAGERRVRDGDTAAWRRLHVTAVASLVLWFLTTLAGSALPNIG